MVQAAVVAITIAGPLEVVKGGLYDPMRAEGIWGRDSGKWEGEEEAEVKRVMMKWFAKRVK